MRQFTLILSMFLFVFRAIGAVWPDPEIKNYYSSNGKYFVRIFPRKIPKRYHKWTAASSKRKKKFQPADTLIVPCYARLCKVKTVGDSLIWEQQLINAVSPDKAIVSNDGSSVVTFDNWGSLGSGLDVMACYNAKGELIKRYKLEDISPFPINTYHRGISSIWWRYAANFIDNEKIYIGFVDQNGMILWKSYDLLKHTVGEFTPEWMPPSRK